MPPHGLVAFFALLVLGMATPVPTTSSPCPAPAPAPATHHTHQLILTLPLSTLPAPSTNLTLLHIALGLGTQNYTCTAPTSTTASLTPKPAGALATLYDATHLVAARAANTHDQSASASASDADADVGHLACLADTTASSLGLHPLGHHFFDAAGTPTFVLRGGLVFAGVKLAGVPAPSGACAGREGGGAVDWLALGEDGSGRSRGRGVGAVYRVGTAGGKAPADACDGKNDGEGVQVDYAAEYWFYG